MAINGVAGSRLVPRSLTSGTAATRTYRLALTQPITRQRYWSWRCTKLRGYGLYLHEHAYGRLLRYRYGRECAPNDESGSQQHNASPSRHCNSWTKYRQGHGGKSGGEGESKGGKAPPIEGEMRRLIKRYFESVDQYTKDPLMWRSKLEKMLREEPYLSMFGWREARGAWNPWAKQWTTVWKELETDWRDMRSDLGIKESTRESGPAEARSAPSTPKVDQVVSKAADSKDEYTFDPITMRKVRKEDVVVQSTPMKQPGSSPLLTATKHKDSTSYGIPVKMPPSQMTDLSKEEIEALGSRTGPAKATLESKPKPGKASLLGFARQPWLSKEWQRVMAQAQMASSRSGAENSKGSTIATTQGPPAKQDSQRSPVESEAQPTDAPTWVPRSSFPSYKGPSKAEFRMKLAKDFDSLQARFNQEISSVTKPTKTVPQSNQGQAQQPPNEPTASAASAASLTEDDADAASAWVKQALAETLRAVVKAKKALEQAKKNALKVSLDQEVKTQKAAMDSFESKPRESSSLAESSAHGTKVTWPSTEAGAKVRQEQKARDQALVQEIRKIYEEKFGVISTEHKQPGVVEEKLPMELEKKTEKAVAEPPPATTKLDGAIETRQPSVVASSSTPAINRDSQMHSGQAFGPAATEPGSKPSVAAQQLVVPQKTQQDGPSPSVESTSERPSASVKATKKSSATSSAASGLRTPETYMILAYDKEQNEVTVARTASSLYEDSSPPRSPSSILTHLDLPHKYFNAMELVEATGYELVAGSRRMLVYRKVRPEGAEPRASPFTVEARLRATEPARKPAPAAPAATAPAVSTPPPLGTETAKAAGQPPTESQVTADKGRVRIEIRNGETQKLQSLHDYLRRLERQQRQMEKSSLRAAERLKSLEAELHKRPVRDWSSATARPKASRLRRIVRFPLRVLRFFVLTMTWAAVLTATLLVVYQLHAMAYFWWVTGRAPW